MPNCEDLKRLMDESSAQLESASRRLNDLEDRIAATSDPHLLAKLRQEKVAVEGDMNEAQGAFDEFQAEFFEHCLPPVP